jgi:hypothetical protein
LLPDHAPEKSLQTKNIVGVSNTEMSNGVLTVKLVAATVWVTFVGGVVNWEIAPKSNVATFVPDPASATPLASVKNVRLIELPNSALTVRVPELVCPCAHAIPEVKIRPLISSSVDRIVWFSMFLSIGRSTLFFSRSHGTSRTE